LTKLCVALTEKTTDELLAAMHALDRRVDLVEVRLDCMAAYDLRRICSGKDRPIIVTNRPVRQGGLFSGSERRRVAALAKAAALGADHVDVELDAVHLLGQLPAGCARIVSHHDVEGTPDDLESLFRRIRAAGADVTKIVTTARDVADVGPVLALLQRHAARTPLIALSMGEEGLASRVLAAKFGAYLTFASRTSGRESAPGQVPYGQMLDLYRLDRIGADTAVYGVVANPVAHSMSPTVQNAAFAAAGLDAVYLPFKVRNPATFLEAFEPYDLRGLSVTLPHKEAMLPLMDELDELAAGIGAVNTVAIRDGRCYGYNTDVGAAVKAITGAARRAGLLPLARRTVLIVGAGGAARAIAYGLRDTAGRVVIANRTVARAEALARELGLEACGLDDMPACKPDVLVNTTSVGMWPRVEESLVPTSMLRRGMVVFDAVYNPLRTRLLREAEEAGGVTASGLEWFVNQAVAQFELWTGQDARREVLENVVRSRLAGG